MSTTSFLDNPLLKVSRPVAACSRCRRAKIKCDGKLPACSACERSAKASTCSSASDEFAKGKERSYVASLEGYCERLEKEIAQLRRRQKASSPDGTGATLESSITAIPCVGTVTEAHQKEVSDIDDLVGDFGFLAVNSTSRDFHGITSKTSFANLLLSVSAVGSLPQPPAKALPPRHQATPLLQYYFDNVFVQMPFFIETNFWTSVDAVYQSGGRFAKPFDHWAVRMVLAIASASLSDQNGDKSYQKALTLVSEALHYSEDVLCPGSMAGIQAILLLAQYSLIDPKHFRAWHLVGVAVRVMVDLGLHQDPPVDVLWEADRLDLRRKIFHCIYCLDRGVSIALERAFSFSDASVNVALPAPSSTMSSHSLAEQNHIFLRSPVPALHIAKIRQILSTGYQEMYYNGHEPSQQPLILTWTLCSKAREWFENSPTNAPHHFSFLYRLEFLYTTAIILSPSHRYPVICDFNKVLLLDYCINYVSQLHRVLESPGMLPFMTFLDIQRAHQVGRLIVDILTGSYHLLLSPSVPAPPPVPQGTPDPPFLADEDRVNFPARALRCLTYIHDLLQHCVRKWDTCLPLEQFEQSSAPIRKRLMQASVSFFPGTGAYETGQHIRDAYIFDMEDY